MNYRELLLKRYEQELKTIELLKNIDVNFKNLIIHTKELTHWEKLSKDGYKDNELFKYFDPVHYNPVIYYFEIVNGDNKVIWTKVSEYKQMRLRSYPKIIKANFDSISPVLYSGSVKTGFAHRLMQHFGYKNKGTFGLHLSDWAIDLALCLKLNYCILPKEVVSAVRHVEAVITKSLNPLIGKKEE